MKKGSFWGIGILLIVTLFGFHRIKNAKEKGNSIAQNDRESNFNVHHLELQRYNSDKNVYFGELHLHTTRSFDAYVGSLFNTPDDAYRYGKGESVSFLETGPIQLVRPLDFMAITDHVEYMGNWIYFEENSPNAVSDTYVNNPDGSTTTGPQNFLKVFISMFLGPIDYSIFSSESVINSWNETIDQADEYYEPGVFTTFAAYEWTGGVPRGTYQTNDHRNVIFESTNQLPETPMSHFDSQNKAENLWKWMQVYRDSTHLDVLSIPHNMNMSDGEFFKIGDDVSEDYLKDRVYNEPIFEVIQHKGQSMEHPFLSPNDEFADYRIRQTLFGIPQDFSDPRGESIAPIRTITLPNSTVQPGMQRGLQLQKNKGTNPFQVGFIGSPDTHDGITLLEKVERDRLNITANGLAAVWAEENTRESIFNALRNKETYATTGSRMSVRFFGGWDLPEEVDFDNNNWISTAYENGVPMGSDFFKRDSGEPTFLIQAIKDPDGANLDRIQVIKIWIDPSLSSEKQQRIYNVAWSGNRVLDSEGNLPVLIDTTGLDWNTYFYDAIGGISLEVAWQDPDFNRDQHAAYYLRVLETPNMFIHQQERAWSSPIYYNPSINQDTVTSILNNVALQFTMYPNPIANRNTLTISTQLNKEQVKSIKIIGLDGRVFMKKDIISFNNQIKIPIIGLSPGMYTVILNDKFTKQLVVQ